MINSAAKKLGVHVSFQIMFFSRYMLRNGIAGSYHSSIFSFLRNLYFFPIVTVPTYIHTNSVGAFPFLDGSSLITWILKNKEASKTWGRKDAEPSPEWRWRKQHKPILKWAKDLNRHFFPPEEDLQIANRYTKRWLPWWLSGEESTCQCRRLGISPWVRKIPWRRKQQPTPVFLPGKSHGQRSLAEVHVVARVRHDLVTKQQYKEVLHIPNHQGSEHQTRKRYHLIPLKMAIQKRGESTCWRGCREKGPLVHY